MRRLLVIIPLLLGAATTVAACGGSSSTSASSASTSSTAAAAAAPTVTIDTFMFQPNHVAVARGTSVHFVDHDAINHSVTAGVRGAPTPDVFDHVLPGKDATFDLTLTQPGTYHYSCT